MPLCLGIRDSAEMSMRSRWESGTTPTLRTTLENWLSSKGEASPPINPTRQYRVLCQITRATAADTRPGVAGGLGVRPFGCSPDASDPLTLRLRFDKLVPIQTNP